MINVFSDDVKKARAAAGLTQAALAEWSGIPKRTIEDWETGKRTPPEYIQKLVIEKINSYNKGT